jgi:hypothetical protein
MNLSVTAIATDVGVSRDSVYRWLRREGVAIGRNGHAERGEVPSDGRTERADPMSDQLARISDEVGEVRREQTILIGRIGRLEGLIEALIGLGQTVSNEDIR